MGENIAISEQSLNRPPLRLRCVPSIREVDREAWDSLDHGPSPFLRHGFLLALESTKSIAGRSGWNPVYLLAEVDSAPGDGKTKQEGTADLVGAVAGFVKTHSYGEYIFDWSWASASERAGIPYYPKLVMTAPVTSATGRRVLVRQGHDPEYITAALVAGLHEIADQAECSSIHWLFCMEDEVERLERFGFHRRATYQFHWHNQGYGCYDDFLARLMSRKRKQMRRERQRALAALDGPIEFVPGAELSTAQLDCMDRFYRNTVNAHGGMDYLRPGFFHELAKLLPEHMLFTQARRDGKIIAGAFFLESEQGLYGRYWGCDVEIELLHFETAFYAGIERCITRGIPRFEAGAQGEHKLLRGFEPTAIHSCHWFRHPGLDAGIAEFLASERHDIAARMARLAAYGPYRRDG